MKTNIKQISILLIALFFINTNLEAQSGNFEFLFETLGDEEGFTGATVITAGNLTFSYDGSTASTKRFDFIAPTSAPLSIVSLKKADFPYLAIKLSNLPSARQYMFLETTSSAGIKNGKWYQNKSNPVVESVFSDNNILYYHIAGANFTTTELEDGYIDRLLFNYANDTAGTVDIDWIKTFASVTAIADYAGLTLGLNDVLKTETKFITRKNKIDIRGCDINAKVEVFSLLGQRVFSGVSKSNEASVDIGSSGIYIVKIAGESGVLTKKVLVN